jgi:hypothetical protein
VAGADLHAEAGGGDVCLRALELGHGTRPHRVGARVVQPGCSLDQEAGGVDLGLDIGQRVG